MSCLFVLFNRKKRIVFILFYDETHMHTHSHTHTHMMTRKADQKRKKFFEGEEKIISSRNGLREQTGRLVDTQWKPMLRSSFLPFFLGWRKPNESLRTKILSRTVARLLTTANPPVGKNSLQCLWVGLHPRANLFQ